MSEFDLTDKVAIVTGGNTGIGRGISLEFAKAGAHVVIGSLPYQPLAGRARREINQDEVPDEIRALGRQSLFVATDVRVPEQVDNMVKQTVDKFGRVDILVNDAGTTFICLVEDMSPNGWDTIININLKGTFLCCRAAGKVMIQQKKGKIINIASVNGVGSSPRQAHYGAAKAGIINFTKSLAMEWAQYNINVNAIAPGGIETFASSVLYARSPEEIEKQKKLVLLERRGRPEDIAYTAIFLASEASSFVTGETIRVGGVPR